MTWLLIQNLTDSCGTNLSHDAGSESRTLQDWFQGNALQQHHANGVILANANSSLCGCVIHSCSALPPGVGITGGFAAEFSRIESHGYRVKEGREEETSSRIEPSISPPQGRYILDQVYCFELEPYNSNELWFSLTLELDALPWAMYSTRLEVKLAYGIDWR